MSTTYRGLYRDLRADIQVVIVLPNLDEPEGPKGRVTLSPLYAESNPAESSHRVLSTKVSLSLRTLLPLKPEHVVVADDPDRAKVG